MKICRCVRFTWPRGRGRRTRPGEILYSGARWFWFNDCVFVTAATLSRRRFKPASKPMRVPWTGDRRMLVSAGNDYHVEKDASTESTAWGTTVARPAECRHCQKSHLLKLLNSLLAICFPLQREFCLRAASPRRRWNAMEIVPTMLRVIRGCDITRNTVLILSRSGCLGICCRQKSQASYFRRFWKLLFVS